MKRVTKILAVVGYLMFTSMTPALSQETYKFELMWPNLGQLWYFNHPGGVAVNSSGHVYVADTGSNRIQKFDAQGALVTEWGSQGTGDGQFEGPSGMALDAAGNLYVTDSRNSRIQKFDPDGRFVTKWGSPGSGDGQFSDPTAVAVSSSGKVYVADGVNYCIQEFDSNGSFISRWGSQGSGDGQFWGFGPAGVAVDSSGRVYVTDQGDATGHGNRIQKFDPDGNFITGWGSYGAEIGQFHFPVGIAVDSAGNVYVADSYNFRIQKFDSEGNFITQWGSQGIGDGQFSFPVAVAVDPSGIVYAADIESIQKFDSNGNFITRWGSRGSGDGQFSNPEGVAIDSSGYVYVADSGNARIQKFDFEGDFVTEWGSWGTEAGQFRGVAGVAVDLSGNVYAGDSGNGRIQKFNPNGDFIEIWTSFGVGGYPDLQGLAVDLSGNVYVARGRISYGATKTSFIQKFDPRGNLIATWGSPGAGDGQFNVPTGVAIDSLSGSVYVTDCGNHRIQKFDLNGNFIAQWGSEGTADGQFLYPHGVAVDSSGRVYVTDQAVTTDWGQKNHRVQKFDSDGNLITAWGSYGTEEGQFNSPDGIAVDSAGNVYVADGYNHRIQKFSPVLVPHENISTPKTPGGPTDGVIGVDYSYSTGGSSSDFGHPVEYRFYWGDGTDSGWSASTDASKRWLSAGVYSVRVKARCSIHTAIESDWSGALNVSRNDLAELTGQWASLAQTCRDTRNGKKCRVSGKLTIQNIGSQNAPSSFVRFYLSDDGKYDEGVDIYLKQVATGTVKAGKSKTKTLSYSFPLGETASGNYVIAVIDAYNTIAEPDENNNYVVSEQIP